MSIICNDSHQCNIWHQVRTSMLAVVIAVSAFAMPAFAAQHGTDARVTVASAKSFDQVADAVRSLVSKSGMMVMAEVDQGKMLSMAGLDLEASVFLIGSPTVGKQLFELNQAVGLYVPLRIAVYTDSSGKTYVQYDKPSALLGQFENTQITMIATMLDEKLDGLATMAAK